MREKIQKIALKTSQNYLRCGLQISQRVGKTLIGLRRHEGVNGNTLVVYPRTSIKEGWLKDSKEFNIDISKMDFCTYLSLHKQDLSKYDLIILDEFQSLKLKHEETLNKYLGIILGLSGTPPLGKYGEKAYMRDKFCPIVYTYKMDEAVEDQIINDYRIYLHPVEFTEDERKLFVPINKSIEYWKKKRSELYNLLNEFDEITLLKEKNIDFQKTLKMYNGKLHFLNIKQINFFKQLQSKLDWVFKNYDNSQKTIVFVNTVLQADKLCKYTYHSKNSKSTNEENLQKLRNGEINILAAVSQLNEGVTIKGLKKAIILHSYSNNRQFSQRMARTLNLNIDEISNIHLLYVPNTPDEEWMNNALKQFDENKIIRKI